MQKPLFNHMTHTCTCTVYYLEHIMDNTRSAHMSALDQSHMKSRSRQAPYAGAHTRGERGGEGRPRISPPPPKDFHNKKRMAINTSKCLRINLRAYIFQGVSEGQAPRPNVLKHTLHVTAKLGIPRFCTSLVL